MNVIKETLNHQYAHPWIDWNCFNGVTLAFNYCALGEHPFCVNIDFATQCVIHKSIIPSQHDGSSILNKFNTRKGNLH